ncbi:hypothetical protein FHW83_005188 [Duganella sp. SG902]|uniref:BrnT family toxin n=1 Tax=Duganella sp. SG902 TaxID=2587016 RepID=UPI00159E9F27|nr:hypothetical protein [Duganella sp. SG902]
MKFVWDERKNQSNIKKHGVSFDEAKRVFDDFPVVYFDVEGSSDEDRYVAIGFSGARLLAVVFVSRDADTTRIISARKASTFEERRYGRGY